MTESRVTGAGPLCLIDTHAHLQIDDYDGDRADVLLRQRTGIFPAVSGRSIDVDAGQVQLAAALVPGIDLATSELGLALARGNPGIFAAVGVHPNHAGQAEEGDWERIVALAGEPDVVAVGETGLDRHWDTVPFEVQVDWFRRHLALARRLRLPVIIHCREAEGDLMPILRAEVALGKSSGEALFGVIHSFSGDRDMAEEAVALGFYLGFSGPVTYTNRKFSGVWDAARSVAEDRILLETDAPFLIPHPFRGRLERNEPLMAIFTARRLAELRGVTTRELLMQTSQNALRLFSRMRTS
ncbi:MAG: TatD family hydrolase [Planctomycetia bacterium]|nr:TatD family hydrolase [Planctomycetia bacterium]